ncbi:MAG: PfkB family carbohydrate kinase [Paracoccaceae bacterium]|nr:PfkB family carbohydrate kinase [Paracoccaceae bacterium]
MTQPILCIGSMHWDLIGRTDAAVSTGADVPGRISRQPGGVALNVAIGLRRYDMEVVLLSAVGQDRDGDSLLAFASNRGVTVDHVQRMAERSTGRYVAIECRGQLHAAVADVRTVETAAARLLDPLTSGRLTSEQGPWTGTVVIDGNLPETLLQDWSVHPALSLADLRLVSASPAKVRRLRPFLELPGATLYLNRLEAGQMCGREFPTARAAVQTLSMFSPAHIVVTDGERGIAAKTGRQVLTVQPDGVRAIQSTGAGDVFVAAHIHAESQQLSPMEALTVAARSATWHVGGTDCRP